MMDPATAYFLKKYYPHVIKWWLVAYNPDAVRIWPSEAQKEETLRLEAIEAEEAALLALEEDDPDAETEQIDDSAYNATTGSYSGLYGQQPMDENTQAALNAILYASSSQSSVDSLIAAGGQPGDDVITPPEQEEIIHEANEIYERLLREAAEDEAKKQTEIEEARIQAERNFSETTQK